MCFVLIHKASAYHLIEQKELIHICLGVLVNF